ncbi:hypothetical protein C0993_011732 [Termitomyces sp. T159_Od127]|nr:hypothetical protein C0993_011732 [Termitomyces sp. T159_Od127]
MVVKKTQKSSQVSYAERVLGALTQVQREHRKQLIHVATLRAQGKPQQGIGTFDSTIVDRHDPLKLVKKNALRNREKLGPHWSSWVGKAIRKLEENGILEPSQSTVGTVLLTALGKKAIADARQSLSAMTDTSPVSVPEDLILKHLSHNTIHGAKQDRPSVRRSRDDLDNIPGVRSKRRRISTVVSPSNSQYSRMTKFQKEKENGLWLRESSPLTDLDMEEEVGKLRDELKEKQREIERITRELLEVKTSYGVMPLNQSYMPMSPEMHTRPSSPILPNSNTALRSTALGLRQTQSGSCISLLSRQPTPPRSPGAISDAISDTLDTREDGCAATSEMTTTSTELKILELKRDVASKVVSIENLETSLSKLREKFAAAERALSERDEQLSTLSSNLIKLQTDASQKALDLEQQSIELCELGSLKARLESVQSSRLADLEHELNERNILIKTISQDREKDKVELALLRESLSTVEREKETLIVRFADTETQGQKYRSEVAEQQRVAEVELQSQSLANKELEGKLEVSLNRISALDQEVRVLQQSKNTADTLLLEARNQRILASTKLQEADARNESLSSQLMMTMDEKSELQAALDIYKDCVTTLNTHLSTTGKSNCLAVSGENSAMTLRLAEGNLNEILLSQPAKSVSTFESELALSKQSSADLVPKLVAIMNERVLLLSDLDKAQATICASASSEAQIKDCLAKTTDDLVKAKDITAKVQEKLYAITDKYTFEQEQKQALMAEIELKQTELELSAQRLSRAEALTEQHQTEVVAHRAAAQELQKRMSATQDELKTLHDLFSSTQNSHSLEKQKQSARILDLEALARREGAEINTLQLQLSSTHSEKAELQKKLDEQTLELDKLIVESQRAIRLETQLAIATEKFQEAEEELLDLRSSKAADEATIETMKEMFSTHVETQTQSLAVFNSQVRFACINCN